MYVFSTISGLFVALVDGFPANHKLNKQYY